MDPYLSSTPTPEPLGNMPPYYRRHNYYLIAIKHQKNQTKIIYPTGKSAAHKTCSFSLIPYTWASTDGHANEPHGQTTMPYGPKLGDAQLGT